MNLFWSQSQWKIGVQYFCVKRTFWKGIISTTNWFYRKCIQVALHSIKLEVGYRQLAWYTINMPSTTSNIWVLKRQRRIHLQLMMQRTMKTIVLRSMHTLLLGGEYSHWDSVLENIRHIWPIKKLCAATLSFTTCHVQIYSINTNDELSFYFHCVLCVCLLVILDNQIIINEMSLLLTTKDRPLLNRQQIEAWHYTQRNRECE